jgi:class 3 adenylate cyclase
MTSSEGRRDQADRRSAANGARGGRARHHVGMAVETRYARSGEVMVAYQVLGEGNPVDLVWAPGVVSHLDLDWDNPEWVWFLRRLSSFARLIRFDKRGTGLSDRGIHAATIEQRTDDIRAVMDAAGSERAVIAGDSEGGCMACVFAAAYPDRTQGLLLWGTQARWVQCDDYPWGFPPDDHRRIIGEFAEGGMTVEYLTGLGAGLPNDEATIESFLRYCRAAASPTQLAALEQMNVDMDIRPILPSIRVPTLVLNRSRDPVVPIPAARQLADAIPGGRLLEFPGWGHRPVGEAQEAIVAAIQEFVTGDRPVLHADRVLATVLFTDIVGSTQIAADLGDARWTALLGSLEKQSKDEISRHRGSYVHTTGDGLLATFDGPARAVRCALAILDAAQRSGIAIRAGCHTGEIELAGDDVQGIAVHIGARVANEAGSDEVLVSRTVRDLVAGSGLVFEDRGRRSLKGVPEEMRLYRALPESTSRA